MNLKLSNKYKLYNLKVLVLFSVLYVCLLFSTYFFYKDFGFSLWVEEIYNSKLNYSNSIDKNKLVLLGGSNVLFSIDAETLEKELNMPVLNLGTSAGLRIQYLLDRATKDFIKPGDTVLLSLEYRLYNDIKSNGAILDKYLLSYDREYLSKQTFLKKAQSTFSVRPDEFIKSLKYKRSINEKNNTIYNVKNLNKNGDQQGNNGQNTERFSKEDNVLNELSKKLNYKENFTIHIIKFIQWCQSNNVKVLYVHPAIPYHQEYKEPKNLLRLRELEYFYKQQDVFVLDIKNVFLEKKFFYDTTYHLNNQGRKIRTNDISNKLKFYLNLKNKSI